VDGKEREAADSLSQKLDTSSVCDAYHHRQWQTELIRIECSICLIEEVAHKATSKADLGIVDKEDIANDPGAGSSTILIYEVFIPDLGMESMVL
jgi:hypothetical protein